MKVETETPRFDHINYEKEKSYIFEFVMHFEDRHYAKHPIYGYRKYLIELQKVYNKEQKMLEIHYEDLEEYFTKAEHSSFLSNVKNNIYKYISLFSEVIDKIEFERETERTELEDFEDALEVFRNHVYKGKEDNPNEKSDSKIKKLLKRKFQLVIVPGPNAKNKSDRMRALNAKHVGKQVCVNGVVLKTTEAKPQMDIARFICRKCGNEILKKINSEEFSGVDICPSDICRNNSNKGEVIPNYSASKFVNFQELKIQELSSETPAGCIPKIITVYAKGALANQCLPGDNVVINGVFLPKISKANQNNSDPLIHDTFIEAFKITQNKKRYKDLQPTEEELKEIISISKSPDFLDILAGSLNPSIHGMDTVKKALILQMVGGSNYNESDNYTCENNCDNLSVGQQKCDDCINRYKAKPIRSDINISLVGDPGVAKSQLLKTISNLAPRSVFTTGKGSSGAGLTAAIAKDSLTNETYLEGGALVLSDKGVCCIDEFDKMDEKDRSSIHEVMEQQTVSISKAGITATLNARTAILAASNPICGRYDKSKSIYENIQLPHSLLSRFDLTFLILDEANEERDEELGRHILQVHQGKLDGTGHNTSDNKIITQDLIKKYVSEACKYNPSIDPKLHNFICEKYLEMRKEYFECKNDKDLYISPRSLLAIIRLSQAIAKLRFDTVVTQEDILESLKIIEKSQESVNSDLKHNNKTEIISKNGLKNDKKKTIKNIIREMVLKDSKNILQFEQILKKIISKGISKAELIIFLEEMDGLNIITYNKEKNEIFYSN